MSECVARRQCESVTRASEREREMGRGKEVCVCERETDDPGKDSADKRRYIPEVVCYMCVSVRACVLGRKVWYVCVCVCVCVSVYGCIRATCCVCACVCRYDMCVRVYLGGWCAYAQHAVCVCAYVGGIWVVCIRATCCVCVCVCGWYKCMRTTCEHLSAVCLVPMYHFVFYAMHVYINSI